MKVGKKMPPPPFFPFLLYSIQKRTGDYNLGEQHVIYDTEDEKQKKERTKVSAPCCGAASLYPWYGKDMCMYGHKHVIRLNF